MRAQPTRIVTLDSLRGVLALYVVAYHFLSAFPVLQRAITNHTILMSHGDFAVDCFFALSGFVMAYVYGAAFSESTTPRVVRSFFVARFARLYPIQLFTFLVVLAWFLWVFGRRGIRGPFSNLDGRYSWLAAIANLLFLQGPWIDHRTWNYPSWSLSAEWHAYLLFPLFLRLARALRWRKVAALAAALIPVVLYFYSGREYNVATNGPISLLRVLPLFFLGILVFDISDESWTKSRSVLLIGTVGTMMLLLIPGAWRFLPLSTPFLILAAIGRDNGFMRVLTTPVLVWLGAQSYSLYMTHAVIQIVVLSTIANDAGLDLAGLSRMWSVVGLAACLLLSIVTAAWMRAHIEEPLRHAIRRNIS